MIDLDTIFEKETPGLVFQTLRDELLAILADRKKMSVFEYDQSEVLPDTENSPYLEVASISFELGLSVVLCPVSHQTRGRTFHRCRVFVVRP